MAGVVDSLAQLKYYYLAANGGNPVKPEPIARPTDEKPQPATSAQILQFLKE